VATRPKCERFGSVSGSPNRGRRRRPEPDEGVTAVRNLGPNLGGRTVTAEAARNVNAVSRRFPSRRHSCSTIRCAAHSSSLRESSRKCSWTSAAPGSGPTSPTASNATAPDANLRRVLDQPTVVRFFRAYGRPVVTRVEFDTEQMTPKKWKSCRAQRHHRACRRSS
jgi:hypothetical protein